MLLLQEPSSKAEKLLVQIYSQIKEPDSIYAVVRNHQTGSLLPLLEHEEAWSRVLVAHDLSQHAEGRSESQRGIANTLKHLGCQSALRTYLSGIDRNLSSTGKVQCIYVSVRSPLVEQNTEVC